MIKKYKILIFLLVMPLLGMNVYHKFYVSVTNMNYSDRDKAFQITTRIFIDDLEAVLLERYGIDTDLATPDEVANSDELIDKYLKTKLVIYFDDEVAQYQFLGKEFDTDIVVCYLEITNVKLQELQKIEIQNEVLTDLFEDQQNIVHLKIDDKRKSFILIRENNKGMLNL